MTAQWALLTNQTNIHKKIDKIMQKLETLGNDSRAIAQQTKYLAQLVQLARQDSQAMMYDMGQILLEVKKSSDRTEERVAQLLSESRKH